MFVRPSCFSLIGKLALPESEYTPFPAGWSSMRGLDEGRHGFMERCVRRDILSQPMTAFGR